MKEARQRRFGERISNKSREEISGNCFIRLLIRKEIFPFVSYFLLLSWSFFSHVSPSSFHPLPFLPFLPPISSLPPPLPALPFLLSFLLLLLFPLSFLLLPLSSLLLLPLISDSASAHSNSQCNVNSCLMKSPINYISKSTAPNNRPDRCVCSAREAIRGLLRASQDGGRNALRGCLPELIKIFTGI